jgi:hypothetical protein
VGVAAPLAGALYLDAAGAVQRWDATGGQAVMLPGGSGSRRLLAASPGGETLAYLETPPFTDTVGVPISPTVRLWRAGGPPQTVPLPDLDLTSLQAQFLNSSRLALWLQPTSRRIGPLYLYDSDGGQVRQLASSLDDLAAAPNTLIYGVRLPAPPNRVNTRPAIEHNPLGIFQVLGQATPQVITANLSSRTAAPVDLMYVPGPNAFAFTVTEPKPAGGNGLYLRIFRADMAGGEVALLLQSSNAETTPRFSPDGRYLLYGGVIRGRVGRGNLPIQGASDRDWRVATLDWSGAAPRITDDQPLPLSADLAPLHLAWLPGKNVLALGGRSQATNQPGLWLYTPGAADLTAVADADLQLLAALPDGRAVFGPAITSEESDSRLWLLAPGVSGWTAQPLGDALPPDLLVACLGPLASDSVLVTTSAAGGETQTTLYRVALGNGARTQLAQSGGPILPVVAP